jgi:hypothetical protein
VAAQQRNEAAAAAARADAAAAAWFGTHGTAAGAGGGAYRDKAPRGSALSGDSDPGHFRRYAAAGDQRVYRQYSPARFIRHGSGHWIWITM